MPAMSRLSNARRSSASTCRSSLVNAGVDAMTDASLHLWHNARLAPGADPAHVIENAAIAVRAGRIEWFGPEADLPLAYANVANASVHDLQARLVTPGLGEWHTHPGFAGNRAKEFAMRLEGATYEEVAKQGGGIVSTVRNTR